MRKSLFLVVATAAFLGGLTVTSGAQACYPTCPAGADARIGGIAVNGQVGAGSKNPVRVAGRNIGDTGAKIKTRAKTNNGDIGPSPVFLFAKSGQKYNVYFNFRPDQGGRAAITACTVAVQPDDVNRSNGCATTHTHVNDVRTRF